MCSIPAREGIGTEARVHKRERRLHTWILQVEKILIELHRQQHAFVDQRLMRQTCDIKRFGTTQGRHANLAVGALTNHVQLALKILSRERLFTPLDEELTHEGLTLARGIAEHRVIDRDGAPAEVDLSLGLYDARKDLLDPTTLRRIARHEQHAAGIVAGFRQPNM